MYTGGGRFIYTSYASIRPRSPMLSKPDWGEVELSVIHRINIELVGLCSLSKRDGASSPSFFLSLFLSLSLLSPRVFLSNKYRFVQLTLDKRI